MLQHIAQHPRLPNLPSETYLLRYFPVQTKSDHLTITLDYLTKSYQDASYTLISNSQVDWILEVLLIAFELPLSKFEQIDQTVDIYSKWLMKPSERLKPMQKNPQVYMRRFFSHFTLIFEKRNTATSQDDEKNHIFLANKILAIFLEMATTHGDKMDDETWEYGFQMLLGIVDVTLTSKSKGIANLAYGVLKTTFEYLLCSLSFEPKLWKLFQEFGQRWACYQSTIRQWNSVCEALTLRVTRILYSVLEGADNVQIMWQGLNFMDNPNQKVGNHITQIELPDEYVFFAWQQCLHVIGNPNNITDPNVFLIAIQGIGRIIDILTNVGSKIDITLWREHHLAIPYAPGANSILRIFDSWLYETINSKHSEYNEGKAVAYKALCTIYCRMGSVPPTEDKLSLFYHAIENGLSNSDPLIVSSIILHSKKLFTLNLKGSFILIPTYINVIKPLLCREKIDASDNPPLLRASCISIISSLICLPNHFLSRIKNGDKDIPSCEIWLELKKSLSHILMGAIEVETSQLNLQNLFWCISIFIHEYIDNDPEMCKPFIVALSDILLRFGDGKPQDQESSEPKHSYTPTVLITLFQVFSSFTSLYDRIKTVIPEFGVPIVKTIAKHIPQQISYLKVNEVLYTSFLSQAIITLTDYINVASNIIFQHIDVVNLVITAISLTRQASKSSSNPNSLFVKKIEQIAESSMLNLYNFLSMYPGSNEFADVISHVHDQLFIKEEIEFWNSDYVRFFLYEDEYIFTIIEQPPQLNDAYDLENPFGDSGCTIIVRDKSGKHVWESRLLYSPPSEPLNELRPIEQYQGSSIEGLTKKTKEHSNNNVLLKQKIQLEQDKEKISSLPVDQFLNVMEMEHTTEQAILNEKIQLYKNVNISALPPYCPLKYTDCKFQLSRLLLTHLGFFDYSSISKMCHLRASSGLIEDLQKLDEVFHRDLYEIGVLFVSPSQDLEFSILSNKKGSENYSRFVSSLGWDVDSLSKDENTGKIDLIEGQIKLPYYSTVNSEFIFHVGTMITKDERPFTSEYAKKKHIIASNEVNVIWTEHTRPYFPPIIKPETPQQCSIILHPLDNGLINVSLKIESQENYPFIGPLFDGIVISEKICPHLIRQTSMNFIRYVRGLDLTYLPSINQREEMIQFIAQQHKVKLSGREYYSSLFNSDKKLQSRSQKNLSSRQSVAFNV